MAKVDKYGMSEAQQIRREVQQHIGSTGGVSTPAIQRELERLSGFDMGDVKVHYGGHRPAQLNAHAYAQGNNIHVAPGQEQHLSHEAWHVVQQAGGRVQPTMQP